MSDTDRILEYPIRALNKATKRILFELADGTRFYLVGGNDRRPLPKGVAGFSPNEMISILNAGTSESDFKEILKIKLWGMGEIVSVTPPEA